MRIAGIQWLAAALFLVSAGYSEPAGDTLALGRKALLNEGVGTAWRLSEKALAEAPQSAPAHEFSGEVLFRRGEFAQAEAEFKRALELDSNCAAAWLGRARIAEINSRRKTAEQYVQQAHELDPDDPRIFHAWAMYLRGQQHIEALEKYASMIDPSRRGEELPSLLQHIHLDQALNGRKVTVLASAYQKTEIPLATLISASHLRSYGLDIVVNGASLRLMLDTGASGIMIQRAAAAKAHLSRLTDATLRGFGDNAKMRGGYYGLAGRVRIGPLEFRDALVSVTDQELPDIQDGLIGTDVFSDFLMTLDFAAQKLRLECLPGYTPGDDEEPVDGTVPPAMRGFAHVYRIGHMLLIPARIGQSREGLFVIDTGAARTLISYDLAAEAGKLNRDDQLGLRGINGRVADVYQTGNLYLEFAGFRQKNLGMTSLDMWSQSRTLGTEVSGFLGLPVMSLFALTIDYRDGLVDFKYQGR